MGWSVDRPYVATIGVILLALILIFVVFRIFPLLLGEARGPQLASSMASLVVAGLFGLFLSNVYQGVRAKEARFAQLRDQHLAQLRPALKSEAQSLQTLASTIQGQGHLASVYVDPVNDPINLDGRIWPETMSCDLRNHFRHYDDAKRALSADTKQQEEEFRSTVSELKTSIADRNLADDWKENVAVSSLQKCMETNSGMALRINPGGGYSLSYSGGSMSNSGGAPSPDQIAAFAAYEKLKPSEEVMRHCNALRNRATSIRERALALSNQALLLSEGTVVLTGDCRFLKAE